MLVDQREIADNPVEVHVDKYGKFDVRAPADEEGGRGVILASSQVLESAIDQARREFAKQRVRVQVPFITYRGQRVVATGIRAGSNGRTLLTSEGQMESRRLHAMFRDDTPPEVLSDYERTKEKIKALEAQRTAIEEEWSFDVAEAVKQAIAEATEEKAEVAA